MKTNLEEKISKANSLLDVLLIMKEKTALDTHVASLAFLEEEIEPHNGTFGIWSCKPFPLHEEQEPYKLQAYYFNSEQTFETGQIVLIVFCDYNFINNLQVIDNSQKQTSDTSMHSIKYGIIIKV